MKSHNLPLTHVVERMRKTASSGDDIIINASIVLSRHLPAEEEHVILAHYVPTTGQHFAPTEHVYSDLRLIRQSLAARILCERIEHARESGSLKLFDGFSTEIRDMASVDLLPSDSPDSGVEPRHHIELSTTKGGMFSHNGPLVSYGNPSFETVEQAVRAWMPFRPFHGSSDCRIGKILIEVPHLGPKLGNLTLQSNNVMRIEVERVPQGVQVEVTGVWQSADADRIELFIQRMTGASFEVSRPVWAERLSVWLTMPDSIVTDFFLEDSFRCSRSRRALYPPGAEQGGGDLAVLAHIQSGEGENLELKPFVKLDHNKFNELIKTVIAFANGRGGTIYMGVSNNLEILGIEKDLKEVTSKSEKILVDESTDRYCAMVTTRICDRVSSGVEFKLIPIRLAGKLLIRVSVAEGKQKPHFDVHSNDIWVRRGANNFRPHPVGELKQLIAGSTDPMGFFS